MPAPLYQRIEGKEALLAHKLGVKLVYFTGSEIARGALDRPPEPFDFHYAARILDEGRITSGSVPLHYYIYLGEE